MPPLESRFPREGFPDNVNVFDSVTVSGSIAYSDIHHNYYGTYSVGHKGGVFTDNKVHDNHQYGERV